MINIDNVFEMNAVWNKTHYHHFGIHPTTACLYGDDADDIETIRVKISDNQSIPESNQKNMIADYWGWFDSKDETFGLTYPQRFLLDMCFPNGIKLSEEHGQGKAYRLIIIESKNIII